MSEYSTWNPKIFPFIKEIDKTGLLWGNKQAKKKNKKHVRVFLIWPICCAPGVPSYLKKGWEAPQNQSGTRLPVIQLQSYSTVVALEHTHTYKDNSAELNTALPG